MKFPNCQGTSRWSRDQRIIWVLGDLRGHANLWVGAIFDMSHPDKSYDQNDYGYIAILVCFMTSREYLFKGLYEFMC